MAGDIPTVVGALQEQMAGMRTVLDGLVDLISSENWPPRREAEVPKQAVTENLEPG